jgi:hypothetical protein
MRVVIKPAGLLILVAVIAALSCLVFFVRTRPQSATGGEAPPPAKSASAGASSDLYAGHIWELTPGEAVTSSMEERTDAVSGVGEPVKIYKIKIQKPTKDPWGVSLHLPTPAAVTKGEKLRMTFRARSSDKVPFVANFEQNGEPYTKSVSQEINTTDKWELYTFDFAALESYAPEKSHTTLHCGIQKGVLEVADLHLIRSK